MTEYRDATPADANILWEMLTYAAWMEGPLRDALPLAQSDPYLSSYVVDFGSRVGDVGKIALSANEPLGAAWLRLGPSAHSSYSVGSDVEPELAIGVRPQGRGRGVGAELLRILLVAAEAQFPSVILSVRSTNPSVRLYERHGFVVVRTFVNRVGTSSLVMRRTSERNASGGSTSD